MARGKFPILCELLPEGGSSQHQMEFLNLKRIPALLPVEFEMTAAGTNWEEKSHKRDIHRESPKFCIKKSAEISS